MYKIKLYCGCIAEPESAEVKVIGTYESLDEACEAAKDEFDTIKAYLCNLGVRIIEVEACLDSYYIVYSCNPALGCVIAAQYYMVSVTER